MKGLRLILFLAAMMAVVPMAAADKLSELRQKADALHAGGKNDSALIVAREALDVAQKSRNTTAIVGINSSMGVYLRTMGKTDEALRHYNEAMKLCTTAEFKAKADEDVRQEAAALYLNLATLHIDMQHKKEAMYYAGLSVDWTQKCADKAFKAQMLSQNGLMFLMAGDNNKAADMLTRSYGYAMELGQTDAAMSAAAYMVATADRLGDRRGADMWHGRCRTLEPKVESTMTLVAYYQILCSIELNHENWRGALPLFKKILTIKGIEQMPFVVYDCYNNMHEVYARLGQWEQAYGAMTKAVALKDSLFESQKAESMRELTVKYQAKEKELELAQKKAELAETRMYVSTGLLVVAVLAAMAVVYIMRQRRRARMQAEEFRRLQADTDRRLMQKYVDGLENELHDGVCNSLYTVQLKIAAGNGDAAGQAAMLDDCREQVRRISHEMMPPEFSYADISMVLDDYLCQAAGAGQCEITYEAVPEDADWSRVADATALEIYRIAQEAVANAMKHSGATRIDVGMRLEGNSLSLTISDNGQPQQHASAGIGRRTMRQRAAAINGQITTESGGGSTTVRLTISSLPEKKTRP